MLKFLMMIKVLTHIIHLAVKIQRLLHFS